MIVLELKFLKKNDFFVTSTPSGFYLKQVKEGFLTRLYIKTNYIDRWTNGAEGPLALLLHSWIDNKSTRENNPLSHARFGLFVRILNSLHAMIEQYWNLIDGGRQKLPKTDRITLSVDIN
jgi:hypothetical protein